MTHRFTVLCCYIAKNRVFSAAGGVRQSESWLHGPSVQDQGLPSSVTDGDSLLPAVWTGVHSSPKVSSVCLLILAVCTLVFAQRLYALPPVCLFLRISAWQRVKSVATFHNNIRLMATFQARTRMSPFWMLLELRMMEVVSGAIWSYKMCKVPIKSSPPRNQHPAFYKLCALPVTQLTVSKHGKEKVCDRLNVLDREWDNIFQRLASEGWWEAWQPSPKVTRSY